MPRTTSADLVGVVAFLEHQGRVFRLLGYTLDTLSAERRPTLLESVGSFQRLTDQRILDVAPRRIELCASSAPHRSRSSQG